jgi:hypothetical protein
MQQQMYGVPQAYGQYYPGYEYPAAPGIAGQPAGTTPDPSAAQQAGWGVQDPAAAAAYYQQNQWGAYYGGQAQSER